MACHPSMQSDYSITRPTLINNLGRQTKIDQIPNIPNHGRQSVKKLGWRSLHPALLIGIRLMNLPKNNSDKANQHAVAKTPQE